LAAKVSLLADMRVAFLVEACIWVLFVLLIDFFHDHYLSEELFKPHYIIVFKNCNIFLSSLSIKSTLLDLGSHPFVLGLAFNRHQKLGVFLVFKRALGDEVDSIDVVALSIQVTFLCWVVCLDHPHKFD
jgi:hypothetical protein